MKKFFAVLLSLLLIFTVLCPYTFAADIIDSVQTDSQTDEPSEPENPDEPESKVHPKSFNELDGNEVVANFYICSKINFLGHVWIYIENTRTLKENETLDGLSEDEQNALMSIPVGCVENACRPGEGMSVGTALFSRANGGGVYYNVEAYMLRDKGTKGIKAKKRTLTKDELIKVNNKIVDTNEWTPFTNCGLFATKVWNVIPGDHVAYGVFPFITAISIGNNKENVPNMSVPETDRIYKQRGKDGKAHYEVVSKASLIMPVG